MAAVPVSLLVRLSQQVGVIRIGQDGPVIPQQTDVPPVPQEPPGIVTPTPTPRATSQGQSKHDVTSWHQAGYNGRGVKIGIIDLGFEGFRSNNNGGDLPARVSARCYLSDSVYSSSLSNCEARGNHGTLSTEVIYDIAPEATYYIARAATKSQLNSATEWMTSQNVDVINHSVGWPWDGPGDGTSPVSGSPINTVATAVSGGALWVNSAGNNATTTWYGSFISAGSDGGNYHRFRNNDICNEID